MWMCENIIGCVSSIEPKYIAYLLSVSVSVKKFMLTLFKLVLVEAKT